MSSTLLPPHANSFVIGPEVIKHTHIRSPIGLVVGSCTNHPGVLASIPKREETGKTGAPCVKVPGSSRVPSDPLSAWWLGLAPATLEFWVRFPNEKNQGKQAHPVLKYRVPHEPRPVWVGSRSPDGWDHYRPGGWILQPATLGFWVRFPNERNQGKQAHPVIKYLVPHGSHTGLGSSSLIAHVLHSPLPPREQLCNRSCSNKTHICNRSCSNKTHTR